MLIPMSMTKRIQVPITEAEYEVFRRVARKQGLTLAEWTRRLLRDGTQAVLGGEQLTPEAALRMLCSLEAPLPHPAVRL